jgi:hypothetical protein
MALVGSSSTPISAATTSPSAVTVTDSPDPSNPLEAVTLTATVTPATSAGFVTFSVDGQFGGPETPMRSDSTAVRTVWFTQDGPHSISAQFSGTDVLDPSVSVMTQHDVVDTRSTINLSINASLNPVLRDDITTLTIGFDPPADTGSVVLREVGSGSGKLVSLDNTSSVDIPWWSQRAGTFDVEACFLGSGLFKPACSPPLSMQVVAYATTTTLSVSPNPAYPDRSLTFDVNVQPPPEFPVTVRVDGASALAQPLDVQVDTSGIGHLVLSGTDVQTAFPVGLHPLVAVYRGTPHTDPSQSVPVDLRIRQDPSATDLTLSGSSILPGQPLTLSVVVTPAPPAGRPVGVEITGPFGFGDRTIIYLDASGAGSTTWSSVGATADLYTFMAQYGGETEIGPSSDSEQATILTTVAPSIVADAPSVSVPETQTGRLTGTYDDPEGQAVTLTGPFGTLDRTGTSAGAWTWTAPVMDGPWHAPLGITATDPGGASTRAMFDYTVVNVPPVVTVTGPPSANDSSGAVLRYTYTATDVPGDPVSMNGSSCGRGTRVATGGGWLDCRFDVGGPTAVSVTASDDDGGLGTGTRPVVVADTGPPSGTITIAEGVPSTASPTVALAVPATDAGVGVSQVALSNDGTTWTTRSYAAPQAWTLAARAGTKTVYAKWRDGSGNWSTVKSDTIVFDPAAPTGTVMISAGATYARTSAVTLAVPAVAVSGISQVALSNDGFTWTTRTYASTQAWTLAATNGPRSVHVKWRSGAGLWSGPATDSIVLDSVAPSVIGPAKSFLAGTALSSRAPFLKLGWAGSDATSGIARYELGQSTDGGAYTTVSTNLTSPTLDRALAVGHTYRLRVRAIDRAGNIGAWAYGASFVLKGYQEASTLIHYAGTWHTGSSTSYWGGHDRYASRAGATARLTFSGRAFAWVGSIGPTRGTARIFVNGILVKTLSLHASSTTAHRLLYTVSWSTSASRTITIKVVGTSGHPRVDVDALVTSN